MFRVPRLVLAGMIYFVALAAPACAKQTALIRTDIAEGYRFLHFVDTDGNKRYDLAQIADSKEELERGDFREVLQGEAVVHQMYEDLLLKRFEKITGAPFPQSPLESESETGTREGDGKTGEKEGKTGEGLEGRVQ